MSPTADYPVLEPDPVTATGLALVAAARTVLGLIALPGPRLDLSRAADEMERVMREKGTRT